jgi:hypothetical protein
MSFVRRTWKDRISEYPSRRKLVDEDGTEKVYTVQRYEGQISEEGDDWSAANMNDLEKRIADVLDSFAASFAVMEDEDTSANDYAVGAFITHLGTLYRVVAAIKKGDSLDPLTNIRKCSVGSMLEHLIANDKDFVFAYDEASEKYGYAVDGVFHPFRNPSGNAKPSDVREGKTFSSAELENATGTLKESTLEVKEDGEYTPEDGELYSKVVVSTGGKGGNLVTKTITKNGTYDAKKEYYDKDKNIMADGFSSVTVNVGKGQTKSSSSKAESGGVEFHYEYLKNGGGKLNLGATFVTDEYHYGIVS